MPIEADDLDQDIAAAFDSAPASSEAPPPSDATPPPSEAPAAVSPASVKGSEGERARGPDGKFIEKPAAEEKKNEAPAKTATGEQAAGAKQIEQPADQTQQQNKLPPPMNWRGKGKVEWARLTNPLQQEISDDYARFAKAETELTSIRNAIGNRAELLAANYGSVEQGLQNLFAVSDMATKNPAGFLQWFAQQRGIDLSQLVNGAQQGQQQQPADANNPLMQEVLSLRNQMQQWQQNAVQGQVSQLQTQIDSFSKDSAHPYFNDVRSHMGVLIGNGQAKTLDEAYEMSVRASPEIWKNILEDEVSKRMAANTANVQRARQASGSLTGSPSGSSIPNDGPEKDLEAEIIAQVNRFRA